MCGIGVIQSLDSGPVESLAPGLELMNRLLAHRGPDGEGAWVHERKQVGFAHRRLEIIDLADRPAADARRRRQLDHLQRRDLQLRRAAATSSAHGLVPDDVGHRSHPPRLPPLGTGLCRAAARHVRVRALGRGGAAAVLRARPLRHQAVLLHASSTASSIFASEAKALLPFLPDDRDRSRGAQGISGLPVLPRGQDAVQRRARAAARPCADRPKRRRPRAALLGGRVRARLRPHATTISTERLRELIEDRSRCICAADVPVGAYVSGGLDSSLIAIARRHATAGAELPGVHRPLRHGERYDESGYARAARASSTASGCTSIDINAPDFRRPHPRRSSTTSIFRSPGRARSRSTWCRSWRAQH